MKNLIIIDDDAIVRESLKQILTTKGYHVSGLGRNANEAINLYIDKKPDLILMDIRMAEGSGIDAGREILKRDKSAKILLLTTFNDKEYINEAIMLGFKGYILKENISTISSSIEAALNGKIVFDSKIMETLSATTSQDTNTHKELAETLSDRELSVLKLVAKGMNNKEIASELYLSEGTVRNYISQLLNKLDLRDRTQLAIYYLNK